MSESPRESDEESYEPIACSFHDELEAAATLLRPVDITYVASGGEGGEEEARNVRIIDVRARDGAEYVLLSSGLELRLDRIVALDVRYRPRDDAAHAE